MSVKASNIKKEIQMKKFRKRERLKEYIKLTFLILISCGIAVILVSVFIICQLISKDKLSSNDNFSSYDGYSSQTIISGSMRDELDVYDLVISRECERYNVGDIITFYIPAEDDDSNNDEGTWKLYTHRIKTIGEGYYRTKGDANLEADKWKVDKDNVVGKVVYKIPKVGKIALKIKAIPVSLMKNISTALIIFIGLMSVYDIVRYANSELSEEEVKANRLKDHKNKHRKLKFNIKKLNFSIRKSKGKDEKSIQQKNG